jgi:hypothetical protein
MNSRGKKANAPELQVEVIGDPIVSGPITFNPEPILYKHYQEVEGLQEDGTYLLYHDAYRLGPDDNCMSLVEKKDQIKHVHYHFSSCKKFGKS